MPDYEIRFYHADGKLAFIHMCARANIEEAREFAQQNIGDHARFDVIDRAAEPGVVTL